MAGTVDADAPIDGERDEITLNLEGCARCHGEGHPGIVFRRLENPVVAGGFRFTHWASCPTNLEPILLTTEALIEETTDA